MTDNVLFPDCSNLVWYKLIWSCKQYTMIIETKLTTQCTQWWCWKVSICFPLSSLKH